MNKTTRLIRSMDGPIRVLGHLSLELRNELDKTAKDLQTEFPITETGLNYQGLAQSAYAEGDAAKQ